MAILYFDNIADMTSSPSTAAGDTVLVGGYYVVGDGGGGRFLCYDNTVDPMPWPDEDFGLILKDTVTPTPRGFWYQRLVTSPFISVKWFGAYGNNKDDDSAAINRAFTACENFASGFHTGNTVMSDTGDATRTRIYFPAGVYQLNYPIAKYIGGMPAYEGYEVSGLEIVGERAILQQRIPEIFPNGSTMMLKASNSLIIKGLTFKSSKSAIQIESTPGANILLDNLDFLNLENYALELKCADGLVTIENCLWKNCYVGIYAISGEVVLRTSTMQPIPWNSNNRSFIYISTNCSFTMKNSVCTPASDNPSNPYAMTSSWISNKGSFRAINVKFMPPPKIQFDSQIGCIVLNDAEGQNWLDMTLPQTRIILKDCFCDCSTSTINMKYVPNAIVLENNIGFTNRKFVIDYTGASSLGGIIYRNYHGLFSIKIDNIPFFGSPVFQNNLIYSLTNPNPSYPIASKDQLELLPFIRINNGLDSYGYAENFNYPAQPSILKFFMGKQSYESGNPNNSAIFGDCSFDVTLVGVTTYDPGSGLYTEGDFFWINKYRVECKVVGGVTIASIVDLVPVDPWGWAPYLYLDPIDNILKIATQSAAPNGAGDSERYGIYYQIRNLIPPVVEATNV